MWVRTDCAKGASLTSQATANSYALAHCAVQKVLTCSSGNWNDKGPQTVVIVVLLGQLLL